MENDPDHVSPKQTKFSFRTLGMVPSHIHAYLARAIFFKPVGSSRVVVRQYTLRLFHYFCSGYIKVSKSGPSQHHWHCIRKVVI